MSEKRPESVEPSGSSDSERSEPPLDRVRTSGCSVLVTGLVVFVVLTGVIFIVLVIWQGVWNV